MPDSSTYKRRPERCGRLMRQAGADVLLLTKPANMLYLAGDGRLCAHAMITQEDNAAMGVPSTDVDDVRGLAHFDHLAGVEDEVGMIHSIAHHFDHFGIQGEMVGLGYTLLTQSMMAMMTHPHAKPEAVALRDCTHTLSELRLVKETSEIESIARATRVASEGMEVALSAAQPGRRESQIAAAAEAAIRQAGAEGFRRTYVVSGPRTNLAHGLPALRRLEPGDLVMIDLHPIVGAYSADICRTVCAGEPTAEQQSVYDLYLKAQQSTIAMVKVGASVADLERHLHCVLREAGHGDHVFGPPIPRRRHRVRGSAAATRLRLLPRGE